RPYQDGNPEPPLARAANGRGMKEFLDMGGYAAFVWPAYGVSVAGIVVAIVIVWRSYAKAKARLAALETRRP
ncbi:MAG TPA: heme exporter protein CcmD, partial [Rhizomicrobium sp.]|nr:heme exporter protein CcmD [Rhizomicrobium sp.]